MAGKVVVILNKMIRNSLTEQNLEGGEGATWVSWVEKMVGRGKK